MQKSFLRIKGVIATTGIARSTIWLWVKQGQFPQPINISPRVTVWNTLDIQDWMDDKIKGASWKK